MVKYKFAAYHYLPLGILGRDVHISETMSYMSAVDASPPVPPAKKYLVASTLATQCWDIGKGRSGPRMNSPNLRISVVSSAPANPLPPVTHQLLTSVITSAEYSRGIRRLKV